ncbi:carboxypeptidase regulatory-like domain-containing protein [candidate division KSB1 bacterium]|nr:carboxypeptidase regulatory-like domain-containing protein [candidate division KSB1 bacterium]
MNRNLLSTLAILMIAAAAWAGTLQGTVYLPNDGGPAAGATVTIHANHGQPLVATTNDAGFYLFESLANGRYMAVATLEGYRPGDGQAWVFGDSVVTLDLFLHAPLTGFGNLEGHVWLPEEAGPAVGATVSLMRDPANPPLVATTNDDGYYLFENIETGHYGGSAELEGYGADFHGAFVPDGETGEANFMLHPLPTGFGNVEGVVIVDNHGGPAAGATVVLSRPDAELVTTTNENGEFGFADVAVGGWDATASLEGFEDGHARVMVFDGVTAHVMIMLHGEPAEGTGTVNVLVTTPDGAAVPGANVNLNAGGPGHGRHLHGETGEAGTVTFEHVPADHYFVVASAHMLGFATTEIDVADLSVIDVTLVLSDSNGHGGGHHGDSLTVVELSGTAIVVDDTTNPNRIRVRYFIDIDADGVGDYRLAFGPPWYNPDNGATRPANGDQITVTGGLLTYADPQIVVVYTINGQFWREPRRGHGGHGGGDHGRRGCNPDSVTAVELAGVAIVHECNPLHGDPTCYAIDTDGDGAINSFLDFGAPDYDPGNGATRPANGDEITIVGGEIFCPNAPMPMVIVYEINGMFWREPGDTLGLGPLEQNAVDEPIAIGTPTSYLTARNYPNPFNPSTIINYNIPTTGTVRLAVYDVTGREVAVLFNGTQAAGSYAVNFNANGMGSGIYFYRLTAGSTSLTNKMMLLR